jgi:predicted glutamine amidotransferase
VLIDELLVRTRHSLIDQSLHSRMGVETTNGDGFGLGWYRDGNGGSPARFGWAGILSIAPYVRDR